MSVSLRSHLVAGAAVVAAAALVASPTTVSAAPSTQFTDRAVTARVDLAASVKPIVLEPLRPEQVATARAAIARIDPDAVLPAAAPAPAPLNAASDWVNSAYQFIQYWVNYGVELADYVLQFVPFGYFIGDQINIFYDFLITPIADSVVYGLIDPVLNDPLNLSTWVNGLINVGQTAITAAINTGIVEFNYFFGWLIPPLPPLPIPPLPLAEVQTVQALETVEDVAALEEVAKTQVTDTEVVDTEATEVDAVAPDVVAPDVVAPDVVAPEVVADEVPAEELTVETPAVETHDAIDAIEVEDDPAELDDSTTTTSGTVSAQGEVRGGGAATTPAEDAESDTDTTGGADKPASDSATTATEPGSADTTDTTDKTDSDKDEKTSAASE